MKKILYILIVALQVLCGTLYAQVSPTTNSPDSSTTLDLSASDSGTNNKGLLIPRMTTAQKVAIDRPAKSLLVYDTDKKCVSQNLGTETAPNWTCLTNLTKGFFYMPSINISTKVLGAANIDLYGIYKSQFAAPMAKNGTAPTAIPQFPNATDLYYYVTYHDKTLLNISGIDENGKMSYTTLKKANYDDYINIVFVVK